MVPLKLRALLEAGPGPRLPDSVKKNIKTKDQNLRVCYKCSHVLVGEIPHSKTKTEGGFTYSGMAQYDQI